jgi:methylphosphotriester-DNA--protein-cysteine methyltransferase
LRRFERDFGISTKAYARIVRFNLLREKILFDESHSFAITAADYEFTDQAHLNKEIKELAGHSPKQMKERFDDTIHTFADGQVEFLAQSNKKPSP